MCGAAVHPAPALIAAAKMCIRDRGIDNDTADGFSDFYVKELIQSLKDGTYKANHVRREYIPKKNGKIRPLGIPTFRAKLLQEVVRMILEAIYEPVFDSHSHGFRPGKSLSLIHISLFVGLTMKALSICIMLVVYGRMIEIYLVTSIAPIPVATMVNREWGSWSTFSRS